ncbi:MAG: hypothetical protein VB860_00245 [Dehalococcoidia bacterium]
MDAKLSNIRLVNGRSEAFGSGELDPGERATVTVELPAGAIASGLNKLTISTREGAVVEIPFVGTTTCGFYLHNNPSLPAGDTTSQADLVADASYPGAGTLHNYDADRDALAGLVVLKGGSGASEADLTQYQNWQTPALTEPLELTGTVRVTFWAAIKDFNTSLHCDITVYLRDYDGASYTEIGNVTVTSDPWDTLSSGTWVKATAAITGLNYTLEIGDQLEIKLVVPATQHRATTCGWRTTRLATRRHCLMPIPWILFFTPTSSGPGSCSAIRLAQGRMTTVITSTTTRHRPFWTRLPRPT